MEPTPIAHSLFRPQIVITDPETQQKSTLRLSELSIEVQILGSIAATTLEVTFYNDHNTDQEGELILPLNPGQTITRYALDIDGYMREGVVVEKEKARKVFEEIVRRQVDPGLVEKVQGNQFKTRVYPLPAKGTRRIRLGFEQTLKPLDDQFQYQLPLNFPEPLDIFRLRAEVFDPEQAPLVEGAFDTQLNFNNDTGGYYAEREFSNFTANKPLTLLVPRDPALPEVATEKGRDGHTWFHIHCTPEVREIPRKTPTHVGLYWDISGSANQRNFRKEYELLDSWFKAIENFRLDLIPFSHEMHEAEEFHIHGGNWDALREKLENLVYDGGTHLGALDFTQFAGDEILLFSDGLQNYGNAWIQPGDCSVIAVNSSVTAHHAHLQRVAEAAGGQYLNLTHLSVEEAQSRLQSEPFRFVRATVDAGSVAELMPARPVVIHGGFSLAGKLESEGAQVTLHYSDGSSTTHVIGLPKNPERSSGLVEKTWANLKLNDLETAPVVSREAIIAHGKAHHLVTDHTSLLVLEDLMDYVKHEIAPPAELRNEYDKILRTQTAEKHKTDAEHLETVVGWFEELKTWWHTDFPLPEVKKQDKQAEVEGEEEERERGIFGQVRDALSDLGDRIPRPRRRSRREENRVYPQLVDQEFDLDGEEALSLAEEPWMGSSIDAMPASAPMTEEMAKETGIAPQKGKAAVINIQNWDPDEPYIKALKKAKDPYSKYLELRPEYAQSPAFFLDVADFFLNQKDERGIRILSNIAELQLGSERLLRLLGYKLLQLGQVLPALVAFEEVSRLKPEEPQSWRDLAYAQARNGKYQLALENYYKVATGQWDHRFPRIELIAVEEMNALINSCGETLDLSGIDPRLLSHLPVALRVQLTWDADNTDLDLWVTDPDGEKCFYSNSRTRLGGRISNDFTSGYGPEIFMLKKAPKGKYKVDVNYFSDSQQNLAGPTSVFVRLFTQFGTPEEKVEEVVLRVKTVKDEVHVGEFEV